MPILRRWTRRDKLLDSFTNHKNGQAIQARVGSPRSSMRSRRPRDPSRSDMNDATAQAVDSSCRFVQDAPFSSSGSLQALPWLWLVRVWNAGGGDAPGADPAKPVAWLAPVWIDR